MPKKVLQTLFFASIHSVIELVEMLFLFFIFFILHQAAASFNLQLYRLLNTRHAMFHYELLRTDVYLFESRCV